MTNDEIIRAFSEHAKGYGLHAARALLDQMLTPERDDEGRTAQDRYDDDCIEQYGCVELDNDLFY